MTELERRKQIIKGHVGPESLKILSDAGINVDGAMDSIIGGQLKQEAELKIQAACPSVDNTMTSELVYLSAKPEDVYGLEHARRLRLIGFPDEQINGLYQSEKTILSAKADEKRKAPWVQRYFITPDLTPNTMLQPGEMTLSELLLITDDANSAFFRDHGWLPKKAWEALCIAACCAQDTEARYAIAFNERTEKMGWSKPQSGAYTKNECLLTERLKWGMHQDPAWSKETTDLRKYQK